MTIKEWFNSRPYWLKGALFALSIWIILFTLLQISDAAFKCEATPLREGEVCYSAPENIIIGLFVILGFPIILPIGGSPISSAVGPVGVQKFFLGSAVSFMLWGILIAWIIKKVKSKRAE